MTLIFIIGSAVKTCRENGQWVKRTDYSPCVDKQASIRLYGSM